LGRSRVGERVDRTNADRQRRYKARKRVEKSRVTLGVTLSAAAAAAELEARELLGDDYERFGSAVRRYVLAVDTAEYARSAWEAQDRPMRDTFANGMAGVHPILKAYEQAEAQAARFADALGLTPASAKRINPGRQPGRPVGSNSAPDRKALPGIQWRRDGLPAPLRLADGAGPLLKHDSEAVNRARGHAADD
jgi:hypothetical protein